MAPTMMSPFERVIRNAGILYLRMAVTVVMSLYATRLALDALGVADFGTFALVGSTVTLLLALQNSVTATTQRFISHSIGSPDVQGQTAVFQASVLSHFALAAGLGLAIEAGLWWTGWQALHIAPQREFAVHWVFHFSLASGLAGILSAPYDATLQAHEHMGVLALVQVLESLGRLLIASILHASADPLVLYGAGLAALSITSPAAKMVYCHRRYRACRWPRSLMRGHPLWAALHRFTAWSSLGSMSSFAAQYGLALVLNLFFGPVVNAAHGLAGQVGGQLGALSAALLKAFQPLVTKSEGAGNRALMLRAAMLGGRLGFLLMVVCSVPVLVEMPAVLALWLKQVPEQAALFCRLLLLRNLVEVLFAPLAGAIAAVGQIRGYEACTSSLTVMLLPLSALAYTLGAPPAASHAIFLGHACLASGLIVVFARRHCGLSIRVFLLRGLLPCAAVLLCTTAAAGLAHVLGGATGQRLALVVGASIAGFAASAWHFGLTADERLAVLGRLHPAARRADA